MTLLSSFLHHQDYSVISNGESLGNLEVIQKEINKCKVCEGLLDEHLLRWIHTIIYILCPQTKYEDLLKDQRMFKDAIENNKSNAKQFQDRREKMKTSLDTDERKHVEKIQKEEVGL